MAALVARTAIPVCVAFMSKQSFKLEDPVLLMNHPRVLVEVAVTQGASRAALLEHTGIRLDMLESGDARVSYLQFGVLTYNALRLTKNPALGLDFGLASHLANQGMLGLAMLTSRTVGDAFEVALEYYRVLAPGWSLSLEREGDVALFRARPAIPFGELYVFATDALMATIYRISHSLMPHGVPLRYVQLNLPEPAHAARYRELYAGPFKYDAAVTEACFDASALLEPLASNDPITAELARRHCEVQLAELPPAGSLLEQVRDSLARVTSDYPTIDKFASQLSISGRTLRRSLSALGASYQDLVTDARKQRALELVKNTNLSMDDIAPKLGFSDGRSFRRAFKQWTGKTPLELRGVPEGD